MRDAWPLLMALTAGAFLAWREYVRRSRQYLRPYFMAGTLHWRGEPPTTEKRIDQG
jgi:hypothetical protein